ncbi:MAG: cob(I)yrinic acid a,c-diamide adenosyltransferase [Proteobacteria bacterium]|nr:cob(I)yrinic acid a,c-diamide adenosyltransferase [Pseudomonadota bacterium]MBU1715326.1 cob(I)yrinic acid a,c-diamide adenosyltransferase [Pseudomonadota bacterium]
MTQEQGLVLIYTGNGKGKTTAAFGQVLRAVGHGMRVCVVQFIKGEWSTGEVLAVGSLSDKVEVHIKGSGFTWLAEDKQEVVRVALDAWEFAKEKMMSGDYDLLVLDELTYLVTYEIIDQSEVVEVLKKRPAGLNVVITGRGVSPALIEVADLVTEMMEVKHHFRNGVTARKGIEF